MVPTHYPWRVINWRQLRRVPLSSVQLLGAEHSLLIDTYSSLERHLNLTILILLMINFLHIKSNPIIALTLTRVI
jgi:hypothetical protein